MGVEKLLDICIEPLNVWLSESIETSTADVLYRYKFVLDIFDQLVLQSTLLYKLMSSLLTQFNLISESQSYKEYCSSHENKRKILSLILKFI